LILIKNNFCLGKFAKKWLKIKICLDIKKIAFRKEKVYARG